MSRRLDDSAYAGNTTRQGRTASLLVENPKCLGCGSSLATRRLKTYVSQSLTTGRTYEVEVYRCGCQRQRYIRRPVEVGM
jgi:hypothetical protein